MKEIFILGCGGHARSVVDILCISEPNSRITFIDNNAQKDESILGFNVRKEMTVTSDSQIFLGIGDNKLRKAKAEEVTNSHQYISIISPKAHIGKNASIDKGCFIGNFCHIGPKVKIGLHTIINNGCIIEHDVTIGNYCHIAPSATLAGSVKLGDMVFIGAGSTIINNINICSDVIIGAGSTVVKDIMEPGTYVGTPAKKIRN